mmetsp:Transcript_35962/g.84241  ORF Transcript_35962/g.84241 Transcript_35962/m.84241 type:complete len:239 (-) Transcript_35962:584-1300(-)
MASRLHSLERQYSNKLPKEFSVVSAGAWKPSWRLIGPTSLCERGYEDAVPVSASETQSKRRSKTPIVTCGACSVACSCRASRFLRERGRVRGFDHGCDLHAALQGASVEWPGAADDTRHHDSCCALPHGPAAVAVAACGHACWLRGGWAAAFLQDHLLLLASSCRRPRPPCPARLSRRTRSLRMSSTGIPQLRRRSLLRCTPARCGSLHSRPACCCGMTTCPLADLACLKPAASARKV